MEDDHRRETTSKYEKLKISSTTGRILLKFETEAMGSNQRVSNEDNLQWKTTSKYEKWNISATTGRILLKFET
jgi:hypothetical protein